MYSMLEKITNEINKYRQLGHEFSYTINPDGYGHYQVELRNQDTYQLIWRAWDYEPEFLFMLEQELKYISIK